MNKNMLNNPYDWINNVSEETKELFELDDMLYKLSINIFDYRNERDLTQKDLASQLGISQAMVSKLESGEYNPTVEQLWKISKKLDFEFDVIFNDKRKESKPAEFWKANKSNSKGVFKNFNEKLGASA